MAKKRPDDIVITGELVQIVAPGSSLETTKPNISAPAPRVGDVPSLISALGNKAKKRFTTFFTDDIANGNTREAYLRAAFLFFNWCESNGLTFERIESFHVAAYREVLTDTYATSTVKQHLAAIRKLFDWLVIGQIVEINPAAAVRGPKHVVTEGLTPILDEESAKELIGAIDISHVVGLRDRALIGLMIATFSRVGAAVQMNVKDYFQDGKQWSVRLKEKNGKIITMPVHHKLEKFLDSYIEAAELESEPRKALFRTSRGRSRTLLPTRMTENDAWRMIRRRAKDAGITAPIGCHTFRGTGITNFLENGGKLEDAQSMAGHSSARTTKLYDRRERKIQRGEVEKISIL